MQDVRDRELMDQFRRPPRHEQQSAPAKQAPFVVRDAPWDKKNGAANTPNLESEREFPGLGGTVSESNHSKNWGPWSKP